MERGSTPPKPPETEPRDGFIAVGYVRGPHGIRGELSVEPLTEFPERFEPGATLWADGVAHTVAAARGHRGALLVELEGIGDRNAAARFGGLLLEVPDVTLPELEPGEYYRFQIVGMAVADTDGNDLGTVRSVLETGANDVYVVRDAESELLIPAIDSVVQEVDVAARRMVVHLLDGLERRPLKPKKRR